MTTYRASVSVDDDALTTSRPLTAPDAVSRLIEAVALEATDPDSDVRSVELVIETAADSDTPVGDSIAATSSTPLTHGTVDDDDEDDEPVGGQA